MSFQNTYYDDGARRVGEFTHHGVGRFWQNRSWPVFGPETVAQSPLNSRMLPCFLMGDARNERYSHTRSNAHWSEADSAREPDASRAFYYDTSGGLGRPKVEDGRFYQREFVATDHPIGLRLTALSPLVSVWMGASVRVSRSGAPRFGFSINGRRGYGSQPGCRSLFEKGRKISATLCASKPRKWRARPWRSVLDVACGRGTVPKRAWPVTVGLVEANIRPVEW